jgi:hypothetical protein
MAVAPVLPATGLAAAAGNMHGPAADRRSPRTVNVPLTASMHDGTLPPCCPNVGGRRGSRRDVNQPRDRRLTARPRCPSLPVRGRQERKIEMSRGQTNDDIRAAMEAVQTRPWPRTHRRQRGQVSSMKRLSINMPPDLHHRFEIACTRANLVMVNEVLAFIERRTAELEKS